jgi:murein DD-endopeptidase MepM/ murein hydrolase activator NlpD
MNRSVAISCFTLALFLVSVHTAAGRSAAPPNLKLQVSSWARAFTPGEVVLVTVRPSKVIGRLEGSAFNRPAAFWAAESGTWMALVGIPLDIRPGRYYLTVRAYDAGSVRKVARVSIVVRAHHFLERRLRVDERFLTPPASEAPRIAREAAMLSAIFAKVRQTRLWHEPFVPPVSSASSSSFGRLSIYNGAPRGRHQGADFPADEGTPVAAPNDGEVVLAEELYFSGNTVVLDHGEGLYSLVAHLSQIAVQPGSRVARGDKLGNAGSTGRVTGPHVHWAMRLGGVSVDPLSLIAAAERVAAAKKSDDGP